MSLKHSEVKYGAERCFRADKCCERLLNAERMLKVRKKTSDKGEKEVKWTGKCSKQTCGRREDRRSKMCLNETLPTISFIV